jgi:hypothetical protein
VKVILYREKKQPSHDCTLGLLFIPNVLSLVTIERPWIAAGPGDKGGVKGKSCVPTGIYQLVKHDSQKHPRTWALVNHDLDVVHYEGDDDDPDEDRATCLIHAANFASQLHGCIAPGTRTMKHGDGYMVCESRKAMDLLREKLPWTNGHTLEISEAP